MSRKPIDQQQPSECRQAVWEWIRKHPTKFQIGDIMYDIRLTGSSIKEYLTGLVKAGHLSVIKNPLPGVAAMYDLVNDTGNDAPRVRKDGSPVTQGQGRQQMWNAMRILKTFRHTDLAFNSSTDEHQVAASEARIYCAALCKAGYLVGKADQSYMLLPTRWTGPHPPQIQRTKQIYDPNLKKVVWFRIEGGAE